MKDVFAPWWPPVRRLLMALSALSVNTVGFQQGEKTGEREKKLG